MDQVILNLAVNARDAMPTGGKLRIVTSRFSCRVTPSGYSGKIAPGEYVMLTVSDNGHGMDAATKAHIFEPFFTTKKKGKGTGLGLATVYGIVSQSNGHIWADSEVGKGTDIHVVLPVVRPRHKKNGGASPEAAASTPNSHAVILLVEDEEPLRELIVRVVADMGCTVIEAPTAEDAIRIARERGDLDVLLTDVVMPKMNGVELSRKIVELHPEIKVLYMSGYTDEALSNQGQMQARAAFLQKPFTPADLRAKLLQVIDASQGANI
jgi:two-component system, cell cycle sensor histidine kinase and response regulator CckA